MENSQFIILGLNYEFNIPISAFFDIDKDPLSFKVFKNQNENLPSWLFFDSDRKLLNGKPEVKDISYIQDQNKYYQAFQITISVSDTVGLTAKASFSLIVYNNPPIYNLESQSTNDQILILGYSYDWSLAINVFSDPDQDTLTFEASLNEGGNLPKWLNFDKDRKRFFGKPTTKDIAKIDAEANYQEIVISVKVRDVVNLMKSLRLILLL